MCLGRKERSWWRGGIAHLLGVLESIGSPLRRPSPPEKFPPPLKPYESFPIHLLRPPFFSGRAPHGPPAATQQSRRARPSRSRVFPHDNPQHVGAPLLKAPAAAAASSSRRPRPTALRRRRRPVRCVLRPAATLALLCIRRRRRRGEQRLFPCKL